MKLLRVILCVGLPQIIPACYLLSQERSYGLYYIEPDGSEFGAKATFRPVVTSHPSK